MSQTGSARARRVEPSKEIRSTAALTGPDYEAAWETQAIEADTRSAEQWARSAFEDSPRALRTFVVAGWTAGLGLRLGPRPSPDYVLGWRILAATPDSIVLGVTSVLLGSAQLALRVEGARVELASFVRFEKRGARTIWRVVQPLHHVIVPYLLSRATG